jgi:phage N-6-adenine-methyltransferase
MTYPNTKTPASERDEARTPLWLFRWLDKRFKFGVDLAATAANTRVPHGYVTKESNALESSWDNFPRPGFLNPPYSQTKLWVAKAISEMLCGFTTVMVIPLPNGESWYRDVYENATEIIDIVGRVDFLRPDGTSMRGNNRGTCIVIFDPCVIGIRRWHVMRDEIRKEFE